MRSILILIPELLISHLVSHDQDFDLTGANLAGAGPGLPVTEEQVSAQLVLDSLACLTSLNISAVTASRIQLISVLQAVTSDWSTLTSLNLSTLDLTPLPSSLLSTAVFSLTALKLNYTNLSREQITAIIRAVGKCVNVETLGLCNGHFLLNLIRFQNII